MNRFLTAVFALVIATMVGCGRRTTSTPGEQKSPSSSEQSENVAARASAAQNQDRRDAADVSVAAASQSDRAKEIASADQLAQQGKLAEAGSKLKELLLVDPGDVEVLFMLANLEAAGGNLSEAVSLLDAIPSNHPEAGIPALGQSAQWCMQLRRYAEAEQRYIELIRRIPDAAPARRQLAYLLNCQGRRHEAAVHVRELCKIGNVRQDELHSLIVLSHAIHDDPSESRGDSQDGVVYAPIGAAGIARKLFTDGKFAEAADEIHDLVESGVAPPAVVALYGRAVVESQDDERFRWWLTKTDEQTKEFADYWAALGTYLISQRRFQEATRALLEAADRDPTDLNSFGRLVQTFLTLGDDATSGRWFDRWDAINETVKANNRISDSNPPDPDRIAELVTPSGETSIDRSKPSFGNRSKDTIGVR